MPAALEAMRAGELDGEALSAGSLDVLCQHLLLTACAGPIDHVAADGLTPLAAPLLLEVGRVPITGRSAEAAMLRDAAALVAELDAEG